MVDRLRKVAEAVENGESWYVAEDWGSKLIAEGPDDINYIATFDPPTVLALLDVVEAAAEAERTYANRLAAESRGDTLDEVDFWPHLAAMERLRGVLRAALGRIGGDTP